MDGDKMMMSRVCMYKQRLKRMLLAGSLAELETNG